MANRRVKLIMNPSADLGRAWRTASILRPIVEEFGGAEWAGTVYPTHATEIARQAAEDGYELVIALGGDGTSHEVINGLMQVPAGQRPKYGVVPLGSGNDFAFGIGMDPDPATALRQIYNGQSHKVDIGVLRDNLSRTIYWDNTVGIGFDATVTIRSRKFVRVRGFLIYFLAVLQTIILNHDAPRLKINTDFSSWEEDTIMLVLCNGGREGGGFNISPAARPDDGILDYTAIRRVSRPMMLRLLPEVMKGTHGRFPQVRMGQLHQAEISSSRPMVLHLDGEIYASLNSNVNLLFAEILPAALEVLR